MLITQLFYMLGLPKPGYLGPSLCGQGWYDFHLTSEKMDLCGLTKLDDVVTSALTQFSDASHMTTQTDYIL